MKNASEESQTWELSRGYFFGLGEQLSNDQIHKKLWFWSNLRKKYLMENFIFCVIFNGGGGGILLEERQKTENTKNFFQIKKGVQEFNFYSYSDLQSQLLNPIQDRRGAPLSGQFFPCNFQKQELALTFSFNAFVKFQGHTCSASPKLLKLNQDQPFKMMIMITSFIEMLELPNNYII